MTKTKQYQYIGVNGILTTPILLEGIEHTVFYKLCADEGKVMTNGTAIVPAISVTEEQLANWQEVSL